MPCYYKQLDMYLSLTLSNQLLSIDYNNILVWSVGSSSHSQNYWPF